MKKKTNSFLAETRTQLKQQRKLILAREFNLKDELLFPFFFVSRITVFNISFGRDGKSKTATMAVLKRKVPQKGQSDFVLSWSPLRPAALLSG